MSHTQQTQQTQQTHNEKQTQHGEQVLFSCSAQAKKKSGLLVLTAARLAWTPDAAQTPALAVPYDAIKAQQVNLPGPSGKVLLKLALWPVNGGPETSHALSFAGPSALADRDRVKDILAQRLGGLLSAPASAPASAPTSAPASRPATPAAAAASGTAASRIVLTALDIQARQALLARDKHLARLHKELVMGGLVSEQEFWDTRRQTLINQEWLTVQKRGTSSESLADLRPSATDGDGSDVKYTLTAEIIHSIFTQFPGVHKAYKDNVPEKLTEKEFWTRYLASKYFHRNRVSTLGKDDELFDKYMKEDETDSVLNPKDLSFVARNPLMDLTTTQEDHGETGNRPDTTMRPGNVRSSLPLIRRFNRHSTLVLKQAIKDTPATTAPTAAETDKLFADETVIEDLAPPRVSRFAPLSIQDPTKYFDSLSSTAPGEAATSAAAATAAVSGASRGGVNVAMTHQQLATLQHHLESWMPGVSKLVFASCQSDQGFHVANEMSRKRRANEQQVQTTGSIKRLKAFAEVSDIQSTSAELLRHFWSRLPRLRQLQTQTQTQTQTPQQAEQQRQMRSKLGRIVDALKTNMAQMQAIEERARVAAQNGGPDEVAATVGVLATSRVCVERALAAFQGATRGTATGTGR